MEKSLEKTDKNYDVASLSEKAEKFLNITPSLNHAKKVFGRMNSQYTSQLMSLTMLGDGPYHFMKQCMAQIDNKKGALRSAYFGLRKTAYKIRKWEDKGDEWSLMLAEEARLGMEESKDSIEHAVKEIKMFEAAYEEIRATYGIDDTWDEADFLKLEEENHIRMAFRLAVRRIMEQNSVDRATSEYFEANGIHPMAGERLARQYAKEVNEILDTGKAPPIKHFYEFLDRMVALFKGAHKDTMERVGISKIVREQATMLTHDHPDLDLYLKQHGYEPILENKNKNLIDDKNG